MNNKMKCVVCHGKSKLGVHDVCWKEFKGFMLSDRISFNPSIRNEESDAFILNGQTYRDNAGRNIVQGHVMPADISYND